MVRSNAARATPHLTPLSALSSESLSLCGRLKRLCFTFRRREGSEGSDATTEYNTVSTDRYEDAPASPTRPTFLNTCACACADSTPAHTALSSSTPAHTPSNRAEPIVLDMNDFELVFDTPVCEICKQGYCYHSYHIVCTVTMVTT